MKILKKNFQQTYKIVPGSYIKHSINICFSVIANNCKKITIFVILVTAFFCLFACEKQRSSMYGVFLGLDDIDVENMAQYDLIVIDAFAIDQKQIIELREKGTAVYSYLNIGTVETYRDYYDYFFNMGILLDVYEDWPDERFIDVSDVRWQDYVVNIIAARLINYGIDGLFLDNFDVYYNYGETPNFLNGLITILQGLKKAYDVPIMINGGDVAVREILKTHSNLIDAVNQECVFTGIDFENDELTVQDAEATKYYMEYLANCKEYGLDIYLLEYGDKATEQIIKEYCTKNGFGYYISGDLELTTPQ